MFGVEIIPWKKILNSIFRSVILEQAQKLNLPAKDITIVIFTKGDYLDVKYEIWTGSEKLKDLDPKEMV